MANKAQEYGESELNPELVLPSTRPKLELQTELLPLQDPLDKYEWHSICYNKGMSNTSFKTVVISKNLCNGTLHICVCSIFAA